MVDIEDHLIGRENKVTYNILANPRPIEQLNYPMLQANCQRAVQQALFVLFSEITPPRLALSSEAFKHWGEFASEPIHNPDHSVLTDLGQDEVVLLFSIRKLGTDRTPILLEEVGIKDRTRKFHLSLRLGRACSGLIQKAFPKVSSLYTKDLLRDDEVLIYDSNIFRGSAGIMSESEFKLFYDTVAAKTKNSLGYFNPPVTLTLDKRSRFSSTFPQPLTTVVRGSSAI